jgi:crotonobetainyl-CoA:carnitine CoA-transferase CaiB-like acyl-CoA transferase
LGLDPTGDVGPDHPRQVRHPVTYSHSTVRPMSAPPALGQDNDQIRAWLAQSAGRPARAAGRATKQGTRHTEGDAP